MPPIVQDYELDTIFADDELYKQGVFDEMPGAAMLNRRRSSVHSVDLPPGANLDRRRSSVQSEGARLASRRASLS